MEKRDGTIQKYIVSILNCHFMIINFNWVKKNRPPEIRVFYIILQSFWKCFYFFYIFLVGIKRVPSEIDKNIFFDFNNFFLHLMELILVILIIAL